MHPRYITGFGLFQEATSSNAVLVLTQTMHRFGTPVAILSDNGRYFVGAGKKGKRGGNQLCSKNVYRTITSN